jgi:peptidyl-prolyl cis-trans isomerase-like 2
MVKHQKEKQYQSAREQRDYGKTRAGTSLHHSLGTVQKTLPFACCALTLTPFETPVCTIVDDGSDTKHIKYAVLFDNAALMEYVLKNQRDPVTGKQLKSSQIIRLHMDQDTEGRWQCPILTKPFADHTKIVAVLDRASGKTSSSPTEAYVYSYEAYQELNVKPKNWVDLTTGRKFHPKKDVILLNDPNDLEFQSKRDISKFWHTQHNRNKAGGGDTTSNPSSNIQKSVTATRILEQLEKERQQKQAEEKAAAVKTESQSDKGSSQSLYEKTKKRNFRVLAKDVTGIEYTAGKASSSLTSTSVAVSHQNADREATEEEILQSYFRILKTKKKGEKGYVKMNLEFENGTASAPIMVEVLLELHCDIAPRTCMNFLGLCHANHYNGTSFHRIIPQFMMQGGKAPDGNKDESFWKAPFLDEFDDRLKHTEAGVLSMANAGPNTNLQQFFITFRDCPHLDRKHSVFGLVVDGMDRILDQISKIETDKKDRPIQSSIRIVKTEIISDPIVEVQEMEDERLRKIAEARNNSISASKDIMTKNSGQNPTSKAGNKIGKYLSNIPSSDSGASGPGEILPNLNFQSIAAKRASEGPSSAQAKKPKFGDFSSW